MEELKRTAPQHIVVLGANGGIGIQVLLQVLAAGHRVTAILRTPSKLTTTHPNLTIAQGDVMKAGALDEHLAGKDIVVSAIGDNSLKKTNLYSQGNENLIKAMKRTGVKRAFFISASGLEINPTHSLLVRLATKYLLQNILVNMYADLRVMEELIQNSDLAWTIVRPPKLLDKAGTGRYRLSTDGLLDNGLKIARADVAHFIVHNINNIKVIAKTVEIAY